MSNNSAFGMLFVILIGAVFAGLGGYMWTEQTERINTYEPTEATVVSSEVGVDRSGDGTTYYPEVTYEYTVDGETYRSSNIYPGMGRTQKSRSWARGIVEDHSEGSTTTAYYDPGNPSNAFLIKNRELIWPVVAGVGVLTSLGGVVGFLKKVLGVVF